MADDDEKKLQMWFGKILSGSLDSIRAAVAEHGASLAACRNAENRTALHIAAGRGREDVVRYLTSEIDGVDINAVDIYGLSPLHAAVARQHYDVLKILSSHALANLNVQGEHGEGVLHKVCSRGDSIACGILMASSERVDVNLKNSRGASALFLACAYGNVEVAALLLEHPDIDVESRDAQGYTPLHFSAFRGHTEVVALLLQHPHIDVNSRNNENLTPLHGAAFQGNIEVTALLLTHPDIQIDESHVEATKTPNVHRLLTRAAQLRMPAAAAASLSARTALLAAAAELDNATPLPSSSSSMARSDVVSIAFALACVAVTLRLVDTF
jgi:ankyrin repeat protein